MRGFLILLLFAGGIYGAVKYYQRGDAQADGEQGGTPAMPLSAEVAGPTVLASSPAEPPVPATAVAPSKLADALQHAAATGELGTHADAVRESAAQDGIGRDLLDAVSADPAARWRGWTRLYEAAGDVDSDTARGLYTRAIGAARDGAAAAGRSVEYVVAAGDSLYRICQRVKKDHGIAVTPGMLRWVNGIQGDRIHPNQRLRVPRDPFHITVDRARYRLRAYLGDGLLHEYPVGLGKEGKTPAATFRVDDLLVKPPWPHPETGQVLLFGDPGYQIGTRWIGFADDGPHKGFGIHGTDEPHSIGKSMSLGCVRMHNSDVEELYELVPAGAEVTIE